MWIDIPAWSQKKQQGNGGLAQGQKFSVCAPVHAHLCVWARARSYMHLSIHLCLCVSIFYQGLSKCLQMLLPFAPLPIKGCMRMPVPPSPALQAYLYVSITRIDALFYPSSSKVTEKKSYIQSNSTIR